MFWKRRIYLDTAAGMSANPSSPHEEGRRAKKMLEDARRDIARLLEVQADDVIFTSGATESNALAILGHVRALRSLAGRDAPGRNNMHVLYLPSAHASVVENIRLLAEERVDVEALPIKNGRVDIMTLATMLRKETVLVSMDAVCGETGIIWNTRDVKQTIGKIFLHVDASQAPHTEKISRAHFGADLLTLDASKIGPIRGVGALIAHRTIALEPLYRGGGQEHGMRSGSEAPALAAHFAHDLRVAVRQREAFRARALSVRAQLVSLISASTPDVLVNEGAHQAPHILNLSFVGRDTDYLVALLDEAGFAVSTKSACETDSEEGSRAVLALTGDADRSRATLRISWGPNTRSANIVRCAEVLAREVAFIDNRGER